MSWWPPLAGGARPSCLVHWQATSHSQGGYGRAGRDRSGPRALTAAPRLKDELTDVTDVTGPVRRDGWRDDVNTDSATKRCGHRHVREEGGGRMAVNGGDS